MASARYDRLVTDQDTLTRLRDKGWKSTMHPDQMIKIYDGYVGCIQIIPARCGRPGRVVWSVWFTGDKPVRDGREGSLLRASGRIDRAVDQLYSAA